MDSGRVYRIPSDGRKLGLRKFFRAWLLFTSPMHRLSPRECDVVASMYYHRHVLSETILDVGILDKLVLSGDIRKHIMEDSGCDNSMVSKVISKMVSNGMLVGKSFSKTFIPDVRGGKSVLTISFSIDDGERD